MSEMINSYLLSDPETLIPIDRKEFYEEQIKEFKENGKPSRACDIIDIFIFNSEGEILIQKRSKTKSHNPGMFDKTIGGHIVYGDTVNHTVMIETVQELQTPSIVLNNESDFDKTLKVLESYTETVGIIKHNVTKIKVLPKIIKGEKIDIANKVHLFFGLYDGRTRPVDREAQGILYYSLDDLILEMKEHPSIFTDDLKILVKEYEQELRSFVKKIQKKA